jgi:uncharacterized membrane protein
LLLVDATYLFAAVGIGVVAGLRSLLPLAAVAWAVHFGWLNLEGSALGFMGSSIALATFSLMALGELVADLFPNVPSRTAPAPLLARILSGGFCAACLGLSAHTSWPMGALVGATGAVIGAFAGYEIRRRVVLKLSVPDWPVALSEDLIAVTLAWLCLSR